MHEDAAYGRFVMGESFLCLRVLALAEVSVVKDSYNMECLAHEALMFFDIWNFNRHNKFPESRVYSRAGMSRQEWKFAVNNRLDRDHNVARND